MATEKQTAPYKKVPKARAPTTLKKAPAPKAPPVKLQVPKPQAPSTEKKAPEAWTLERYLQEFPERAHVVAIVETSERTGRPTRVRIRCQAEGCGEEREIAAQDAFQVRYCSAAHRRIAARARQKEAQDA